MPDLREPGGDVVTGQRFANVDEFYAANPARRNSGEADYGVHWRDGDRDWPRYRVSYVQATGEIYAVALTPNQIRGVVEILGVVEPDEVGESRAVTGRTYYRTLDRILDGWAEPENLDLAWVRRRLADSPAAA